MVSKNRFVAEIDSKTFLDSADTISLIDSAYIQARQIIGGGGDSATTITLIQTTVDSAYVQARQTSGASFGITAPTNPTAGDLWFDTEDLTTYVYYVDSAVSNWVTSVPASAGLDSGQVTNLITANGSGFGTVNVSDQTLTSDVTVLGTQNAMSVGPIIVDSGVTLTIKTGARYVVI